jgi:hypothetical protein
VTSTARNVAGVLGRAALKEQLLSTLSPRAESGNELVTETRTETAQPSSWYVGWLIQRKLNDCRPSHGADAEI